MLDTRFASRLAAPFAAILLLLGLPGCNAQDGYMSQLLLSARQMQYLDYASEELHPGSFLNLIAHMEKEVRNPFYSLPAGSVPDDAWDATFEKLYALRDTSDFQVMYLLNLLYGYRGHPAVSEALWQDAEEAILSFKYWFTDPTPEREIGGITVIDTMWYWTENHVFIFRICEYLAGQMFPDEVFEVSGLTGQEHMDRARPVIENWLDERSRWGFAEWHSNVYYNLDMLPLLTLIEWSGDAELVKRARMVLDLVWLDVALHLQNGHFGATHGRSYAKDKGSPHRDDTFNATKMLFADTELGWNGRGSSNGTLFARSHKYRLPEVIRRIASSTEPHWDRERMSLPMPEEPPAVYTDLPPAPPFGLDYTETHLDTWWGIGAQPAWPVLPLTLSILDRYNLWEGAYSDFADFQQFVVKDADGIIDWDLTLFSALPVYKLLWRAFNQATLSQVNTATYRTDDYMLSTAQDYRKGLRGSQTHTWQATLSGKAMVFVNHPGELHVPPGGTAPSEWNWQREDEPGPGYWTGEGAQPRAAQHENVVISIHAPQYPSAPFGFSQFSYVDETHAYFPHAQFDEVDQQGQWTFGRKGKGYVALFSHLPTSWRTNQPELLPENAGQLYDLVAAGKQNVWIVECGSEDEWGSFANFKAAVVAADVTVTPIPQAPGDFSPPDGFDVTYVSPSLGAMSFGWYAPLMVAGVEQPIAGYPRISNEYVHTEFDDTRYEVSDGSYALLLDFDGDVRETMGSGGPPEFWQTLIDLWFDQLGGGPS